MSALLAGVVAALKADADLMALATGVYLGAAPPDAEYPFVLVSWGGGADGALMEGGWYSDVLRVHGVDYGPDDTRAHAIAGLIDVVLTKANVSIAGYTVLHLRREAPVLEREAYSEDEVYWHVGGSYRISFI